MNVYGILKRVTALRSPRMRLAMFLAAHLAGRRNIGVYIDPVLACNIRCRMCAFSDPDRREALSGRMSDDEIRRVAAGLMPRALKVQVGCGAEPTLDRRTASVIAQAKRAGVPYVALTTNGQVITDALIADYADAGLDEITLSLHGTTARTYEWLMEGASFERLRKTIEVIRRAKSSHPSLRLRVNYTVNADNVGELSALPDFFGRGVVDILQVRPVQRLGNTSYDNFDLTPVVAAYESVFVPLAEHCRREGIECLMPTKEDIASVGVQRDLREALFEQLTYCYVGPGTAYASGYDPSNDTYATFHRRNHTVKRLFKSIFSFRGARSSSNDVTKKLNYRVRR